MDYRDFQAFQAKSHFDALDRDGGDDFEPDEEDDRDEANANNDLFRAGKI